MATPKEQFKERSNARMTAAKVAQRLYRNEYPMPPTHTRKSGEYADKLHKQATIARLTQQRDDLLAALRQAMPVLERAAATERVANRLTGGAGTQANDALTASEFAIKQAEK